MPTLIIKRKKEYFNFLRNYQIFVDEKKIGEISYGETKEFEINSGIHKLEAKIDWCSSAVMDTNITEVEKKEVIVKSFMYANWLVFAFIGAMILSFVFNFKYALFLLIPLFVFTFYYITFGRKKYLVLEEV